MVYRFREFELDQSRRLLLRRGIALEVGQLGFDVLVHLVENRSAVVSQEQLRAIVWKGRKVGPSTIPTAINVLRRALNDSAKSSEIIRTVYGKGYRWILEIDDDNDRTATASSQRRVARGFFGRSIELDELTQGLKEKRSALGDVTLVSGEPGIGKTRLLDELAHAAERLGCAVAIGKCSELAGVPAFWPLRQILDDAGIGSLWGQLRVLALKNSDSAENAGAARFELFQKVAQALERDPSEPQLLIVDDLHCADLGTVHFLRFLVERGLRGNCVAVSLRPVPDGDERSRLIHELCVAQRVRQIRLGGLEANDARNLVESVARFKVNDILFRVLAERSGGNPLFLEQLAKQLNACLKGGSNEGMVEEARKCGQGIRWAVERSLSQLSPDEKRLLTAGSVVGREFDLAVVAQLMAWKPENALQAIENPLALEIIEETEAAGRYRFSHAIQQEVLYEAAKPLLRLRIHRAALEALEETHGRLTGDIACLAARHRMALPPGEDWEDSVRLLDEAASWSEQNLGFEEAVSYLEGAARVLSATASADARVRVRVLTRLGGAQRRAGAPEEAATTCRRATELAKACDDPALFAEAVLGYSPGFFALETGVVDEYLVEGLRAARQLARRCEPGLRARIAGRLAMALYWSEEEETRNLCGEEALELAELSSDETARAFAVTAHEASRWGPERAEERARLASWAIERAEAGADREMELVYRLFRMTSLLQIGDFNGAWRELEVFSRRAKASLHGGALWYRDLFGTLRAMMHGDWPAAESLADEFVRLGGRVKDRNAEHCGAIHRAYREMEYGDETRASRIVEGQARDYPRVVSFQCGRAFLYAATGEFDRARAILRRLVTKDRMALARRVDWLIGAALLSETCVLLKDRARARTLLESLRKHEDEFVVVVFSVAVWRPVSYFLGRLCAVLGRYEDSERLFNKAISQSRMLGASPWLAHSEFGYAEMLRRRAWAGDGRRARHLALSSEGRARELGMLPLLARTRDFLWGSGPKPGRA